MSLNSFIRKLVPKSNQFTPMFNKLMDLIVAAAEKLNQLLAEEDKSKHQAFNKEIKFLEEAADDIAHQVFEELDKTFITPFDREDIHHLTSHLDDVLDFINGVSNRVWLLKPEKLMPDQLELSHVVLRGCRQLQIAVAELPNLKKPEKITEACIKINELENIADDVYHQATSKLFAKEKNAIEIIKHKEILDVLENITDRIEDAADIIKTIMLKVG